MTNSGSPSTQGSSRYQSVRDWLIGKYRSSKSASKNRSNSTHLEQHLSSNELLVQPFNCGCGRTGILVCLGNRTAASRLSQCQPLSNSSSQPCHEAGQTSPADGQGHERPAAVCCVTHDAATTDATTLERPVSPPDVKFVTFCVFVMVDDKWIPIEGFMDTGAGVSIMKESMAKGLKLDYRHEAPRTLKPFGGGSVKARGLVRKVPLRTGCQKSELEDFYVVADHHWPEKKDAYFSLSLILRLKHFIRPVCGPCDL